jgi:putative flippase GtrA
VIKRLICNELVVYIFFGVLTTVINYGVFYLFYVLFGEGFVLVANIIAFIFATAFAYITNKLFVFHSRSWDRIVLRREIAAFFGARIVSFLFEELGLFVCANLLNVGRYILFGLNGVMIAKIALSFVAVAINYFLSKLYIFAKKEG